MGDFSREDVLKALMVPKQSPVLITREKCKACNKTVYANEKVALKGETYHKTCLKCRICNTSLSISNYILLEDGFYCEPHSKQSPETLNVGSEKTVRRSGSVLFNRELLQQQLAEYEKEKKEAQSPRQFEGYKYKVEVPDRKNQYQYQIETPQVKNQYQYQLETPQVNTPEVKVNTPEVKVNTPEIKVNTPEIKVNTPEIKVNTPEVIVNVKPDYILWFGQKITGTVTLVKRATDIEVK